MKLFGFTIIRTKKFNDIELRKWCVEKSMWCRGCDINEYTELLYRYIKNGDTAIFEELQEFKKWKKEKEENVGG